MSEPSTFWRDPALPAIEARHVLDGRCHGHAAHSHETFSIGAITAGRSGYLNLRQRQQVAAGSVVLVNPGDLHACNPVAGEPWAYLMFYVDVAWLHECQRQAGLKGGLDWQPSTITHSCARSLYNGLIDLHQGLRQSDLLGRQQSLAQWGMALVGHLHPFACPVVKDDRRLQRAEAFIREHCEQPLTLEQLCAVADLSPSQLIRSFKRRYGFTPHAFVLDRRLQRARAHLRSGASIAEAAQWAGFADQAHLQRTFKRHLAATPGHYRASHR